LLVYILLAAKHSAPTYMFFYNWSSPYDLQNWQGDCWANLCSVTSQLNKVSNAQTALITSGDIKTTPPSCVVPSSCLNPATGQSCSGCGICKVDGTCDCRAPFGGQWCNQCLPGFYDYGEGCRLIPDVSQQNFTGCPVDNLLWPYKNDTDIIYNFVGSASSDESKGIRYLGKYASRDLCTAAVAKNHTSSFQVCYWVYVYGTWSSTSDPQAWPCQCWALKCNPQYQWPNPTQASDTSSSTPQYLWKPVSTPLVVSGLVLKTINTNC